MEGGINAMKSYEEWLNTKNGKSYVNAGNIIDSIIQEQEYEEKKKKTEENNELIERIEKLEFIVKELERKVKLLESKNNDGWCNK